MFCVSKSGSNRRCKRSAHFAYETSRNVNKHRLSPTTQVSGAGSGGPVGGVGWSRRRRRGVPTPRSFARGRSHLHCRWRLPLLAGPRRRGLAWISPTGPRVRQERLHELPLVAAARRAEKRGAHGCGVGQGDALVVGVDGGDVSVASGEARGRRCEGRQAAHARRRDFGAWLLGDLLEKVRFGWVTLLLYCDLYYEIGLFLFLSLETDLYFSFYYLICTARHARSIAFERDRVIPSLFMYSHGNSRHLLYSTEAYASLPAR
jgi:hypothetical protein